MCTPENRFSVVRLTASCSDNDGRIDLGQLEPSKTDRSEDTDEDADDADNSDDGKTGPCPLTASMAHSGNWLTAANIDGVDGTSCVRRALFVLTGLAVAAAAATDVDVFCLLLDDCCPLHVDCCLEAGRLPIGQYSLVALGRDGENGSCPMAAARALSGNWLAAVKIDGVNGTAFV
jgi:hypothetical protein